MWTALVGQAAATGVAAGEDRVEGRQRLLPLEDAALVQAQQRYIVGLAKNKRLNALSAQLQEESLSACHQGEAAPFWGVPLQGGHLGAQTPGYRQGRAHRTGGQPEGDPQALYDTVYCARGEMENRIKEQQLGLFADRTSCSGWWANQFRLLLSSCAYVLMETIRRVGLRGTDMARAQVGAVPGTKKQRGKGQCACGTEKWRVKDQVRPIRP